MRALVSSPGFSCRRRMPSGFVRRSAVLERVVEVFDRLGRPESSLPARACAAHVGGRRERREERLRVPRRVVDAEGVADAVHGIAEVRQGRLLAADPLPVERAPCRVGRLVEAEDAGAVARLAATARLRGRRTGSGRRVVEAPGEDAVPGAVAALPGDEEVAAPSLATVVPTAEGSTDCCAQMGVPSGSTAARTRPGSRCARSRRSRRRARQRRRRSAGCRRCPCSPGRGSSICNPFAS